MTTPLRDPRRAYQVVDLFEQELCDYTGAPYAVTVDSCTNSLFLTLRYERKHGSRESWPVVRMPSKTYVGVLQAILNAGFEIEFADFPWINQGWYFLPPTRIIDSARHIAQGMYQPGTMTCLSFHAVKQLGLGRGGAILTDNEHAADWLQAARMDGRPPGAPLAATRFPGFHCPLPPDTAARGLWTLARWNDSGYTPPPLPVEEYPDLSTLRLP